MEIWIKAAQLILSLSILIVLHELGHMLPAKWFKTRVEKFYLFFNPGFSLFKFKKGETEYGMGWIPLGGYVKISGMIDESMDKEQLKKPAESWEFRSKPTWQRLIIMIGGVTVNLLLGFFIYIMILFVWGEEKLPTENVTYGAHLSADFKNDYGIDLQEGDNIIMADGLSLKYFEDVNQKIIIDRSKKLTVLRNNDTVNVILPDDFVENIILKNNLKGIITIPRYPNIVEKLIVDMPAKKSGLKEGDTIVGFNNSSVVYFQSFSDSLQNYKGKEIALTVKRAGTEHSLSMTVTSDGTIGYYPIQPRKLLSFENKQYSFFEAIPAGLSLGYTTLTGYVKSLSLLFSKEGAKQIGGFGTIGSIFPDTWDWRRFWGLTAFLSIILAFMNILPIPALDGGHVMFLIYEMVSGKAPGEKFLTRAQVVGMVLLLGLLLYANGMDVYRWITGS